MEGELLSNRCPVCNGQLFYKEGFNGFIIYSIESDGKVRFEDKPDLEGDADDIFLECDECGYQIRDFETSIITGEIVIKEVL